ncbi:MAG: sterol desaturase family protein [Rudaea sp.]|nr:sterol desaturase family protein [Rudaea sp.]
MNIETPSEPATESVEFAPGAEFARHQPEPGRFDAARRAIVQLSTTRANGQAGLVADVAMSVVLLGTGFWRGDARAVPAIFTVLLGLFLFSFIEYCFHRWLFHGPSQIVEQGHRKHHEQPLGYDALPFFVPPLALLLLVCLFNLIVPASFAFLLAGSLAAGYAAYGLSHAAIHSMRFRYPLSKRWAAFHHIHHYHPETNFGVTTPLWDILLGTQYVSNGKGPKRRETVAATDR